MPRWGWAIAGLAVAIAVATYVGQRLDPKSGLIEDMGRSQIAQATGHHVSSIKCERKAQIRTDIDLPCRVTLADGTTFDTVAHVSARFENAAQYHYRATFSPLPSGSHDLRAAPPGRARSPDDARLLADCIQAAGTDNAQLQACAARFEGH